MTGAVKPSSAVPTVTAAGEFARRLTLTRDRLLGGEVPTIDDAFVLADVRLEPPRRFNEFSGDLSGRWIGALAADVVGGTPWPRVDGVVRAVLAAQRADGRIGSERLAFTAEVIGREHMPLLWGNGRLLVGLLEHHAARPAAETLAAARRLGDFCTGAAKACLASSAAEKLRDQGAFGWICCTQLSEGLALLARATGERPYADVAVALFAALGPRHGVHSHGWLSTLRGALLVAEDRGDRALVERVRALVDEVVAGGDRLACGGVPEYFRIDTTRGDIAAHSGASPRDEGCSEADFVRLCLQLWRLTGDASWLERGEHAFVNHLHANQFPNGDFGHRVISRIGFAPADNHARAWWCCTPHGLRAARDLLDAAVVAEGDGRRIDLAVDCAWSGATGAGRLLWTAPDRLELTCARDARVRLRQPGWGRFSATGGADADGFLVVQAKAGVALAIAVSHRLRLVGADLRAPAPPAAGKPLEAAVFLGPWLLAVDDLHDHGFFGEPWWGNRLDWRGWTLDADGSVALRYEHDGFVGSHPLRLRPVGRTGGAGTVAWLLKHAHPPSA